jgi:hypothetical protein
MPFTLAHPAAVLPLRRYCPRYLSFSALVIGSIAPDAGYAFGRFGLDEVSHHFWGSFTFSLPVGMLMLGLLYLLRGPLVERLPQRFREVFRPLCRRPIASLPVLVISLLLGSWTHLAWDSFTHTHGWLVAEVPWLRAIVVILFGHAVRVCHLLWYVSSFGGVAMLCYGYERWRLTSANPAVEFSRPTAIRHAVLVGLLVLPIEMVHHLYASVIGFALLGACSMALVFIVALTIGVKRPQAKP